MARSRKHSNKNKQRHTPAATHSVMMVQPKLTAGAVNSAAEHEADATANSVMRMPQQNFIKRKCADCEKEEKLQRQPSTQAKTESDVNVSTDTANTINASKGKGDAINSRTQNFMSSRFGTDFSHVKIHTDNEAIQLNRSLHAKAFTVGSDIYFNEGQYQPNTVSGKHLLAHELTHTMQQGDSNKQVQRLLEVNTGVDLDTMGYSVIRDKNFYTNTTVVKTSLYNEIVTALLNSERKFKITGTTTGAANENFRKHINARANIVAFAGKKEYAFGAGKNFKMNEEFWTVDYTTSKYTTKPGKDRQKAIEDLNKSPGQYHLSCEIATELTMEGGAKSNDIIKGSTGDPADWIPGDWGYIINNNFPKTGGIPGREGENIIYIGSDKFWGHGASEKYQALAAWVAMVNTWNNNGAEVTDSRRYTRVGLE